MSSFEKQISSVVVKLKQFAKKIDDIIYMIEVQNTKKSDTKKKQKSIILHNKPADESIFKKNIKEKFIQ